MTATAISLAASPPQPQGAFSRAYDKTVRARFSLWITGDLTAHHIYHLRRQLAEFPGIRVEFVVDEVLQ